MPVKGFAASWWGISWIKALEEIDRDTNRLPRGRTYARNGSVLEITQNKKGAIQARVQGRRVTPYKIRLSLEQWSEEQIATVLDLIKDHPAVSSQLLIGKMPETLESMLKQVGIGIFPSRWADMQASCSCPDWANPCKHIAAVDYLLAAEIDKDPFLLFEMRGLKKTRILESAKLAYDASNTLRWVFDSIETEDANPILHPGLSDEPAAYQNLQPCPIARMVSLLGKNPPFDSGASIATLLPRVYGDMQSLQNREAIEDREKSLSPHTAIIVEHRDEGAFFHVYDPYHKTGSAYSSAEFLQLADQISLASLPEDTPSVRWLKEALSFAGRLIALNSWFPVVIPSGAGEDFSIRYAPNYSNIAFQTKKSVLNDSIPIGTIRDGKGNPLLKDQSADYILSLLITEIIHSVLEGNPIFSSDEMSEVFFQGKVYHADVFLRRQTKAAVQNWLTPLYLSASNLNLVLFVEAVSSNRFSLVVKVKNKKDLFLNLVTVSEFLAQTSDQHEKESVLKQVACLSEWIPSIKHAFDRKPISLGVDEFINLLSETRDYLEFFGAELVIPKGFKDLTHPKIAARASSKTRVAKNYLSLDSLLSFEWRIQLGEDDLSTNEFAALIEGAEKIIQFKDNYYLIDPNEAKRMLEKLRNPPGLDGMETLRSLFSKEVDGYPLLYGEGIEALMKQMGKTRRYDAPRDIVGQLRPYQLRGYQWILSNFFNGFNVCLADDMGMGKTIQVISVLLKLRELNELNEPALVICPASVALNWRKEITKFAPDLKNELYFGNKRTILPGVDVWITTYGTVRSDLERLLDREWSVLAVDEAQNIKNPDTDQSKAVSQLRSKYKIAMSGTPVENRIMELWSLFNLLMPGFLGRRKTFHERFAVPIERYNDENKTRVLRNIVSPFLLRRVKTDKNVIKDLPEKIVCDEYALLKPEQAALYKSVLDSALGEIENSEGIKRKGKVLWLITALKQICNHPVLYTKTGKPLPENSGKAEAVFRLLDGILAMGKKALLFTQYREMGRLLVEMIQDNLELRPLFFHGGVDPKGRQKLISDFQEDPYCPLMIITLKAGGTGINLTAATHVIHYDLWWNPAVENQATDRTYRIGQKECVTAHRLLTQNTFEERINEMLLQKTALSDSIVGAGEKWITEMNNQEIRTLFSLTRDRLEEAPS